MRRFAHILAMAVMLLFSWTAAGQQRALTLEEARCINAQNAKNAELQYESLNIKTVDEALRDSTVFLLLEGFDEVVSGINDLVSCRECGIVEVDDKYIE